MVRGAFVRGMSVGEQLRLMSLVDVFEPLSREELEDLARRAPDVYLDRGEVFHTPEENGERLFVLKKGRARVYEVDAEGRELTLSVVEGGTVIGEMALTGQRLLGVYAQALEPSVVVSLKRGDLEGIVLRNPEVGLRLIRLLSGRLREAETRLAELTHKEVPARLASQILRLVESEGVVTGENERKIPTRYTHESIATMIGSKRVPVTRAFAKLKEGGAVELRDRHIHVTDLEALKRAAEDGRGRRRPFV